MITLYNVGCKFPVKEMEKSELRLLVIEDEKKLCDMIAKSLHMAGYEVDMCNDGERALDMMTSIYMVCKGIKLIRIHSLLHEHSLLVRT